MIVARFHDYQADGIGSESCVTDKSNLSSDYYACDKRPSLLVLLLLLMLLLFLMMPKLKLASAVPRRSVFWGREVGRAVYLSVSLTESCLLEISTYPSTVVSVPLCPALISLTLKMPAYLAAP